MRKAHRLSTKMRENCTLTTSIKLNLFVYSLQIENKLYCYDTNLLGKYNA